MQRPALIIHWPNTLWDPPSADPGVSGKGHMAPLDITHGIHPWPIVGSPNQLNPIDFSLMGGWGPFLEPSLTGGSGGISADFTATPSSSWLPCYGTDIPKGTTPTPGND